jgi:hypothetical protein
MRNLIIILSFVISCCGVHASEPSIKDYYILQDILNNAKKSGLNKLDTERKIIECSEKGNKYCSYVLGMQNFNEKNYNQAFKYLSQSDCKFQTISGNDFWPSSIYLGMMYLKGWGVEKNLYQSISYFKECVQSGESSCAVIVANIYGELGIKNHDLITPTAWLKVAKKMGATHIDETNSSINDTIYLSQLNLNFDQILQSDILANNLCKNIPHCDISK